MSTTSLALSPSPQSTLREKLSLNRFRSRTPSNAGYRLELVDSRGHPQHQNSLNVYSPGSDQPPSPTDSELNRPDSRPSFSEPTSPHTPFHLQEYHPYANPDLAPSHLSDPPARQRLEELHALTCSVPQSPMVNRSESTATITESSTATTMSTMSQSRSQTSVLTPGTSVSSLQHSKESFTRLAALPRSGSAPVEATSSRSRASDDSEGQEILFGHPLPSPSILTPSWPHSPNPIPIKLISLEEAQAQARERSRSATATATMVASSATRTPEPSPAQSSMSWTRMRSASGSSSKAKNMASASSIVLTSTPTLSSSSSLLGANGPPQRTVARKKSGFMRLFNTKERAPASPPPVPSLSADMIASVPTIITSTSPPTSNRSRKQSAHHRVPVPSLTPSLLAESEGGSGSSHESYLERPPSSSAAASPVPRERQLSARRNAPGLFIMTSPSPPSTTVVRPSPPLGTTEARGSTLPTPTTISGDPLKDFLSPNDSKSPKFVGLSLRPVSAIFGPEISGQIIDSDEYPRPSLETDMGTPTTGASAISPRSPSPMYKTDDPLAVVNMGDDDDQPPVVRAIREQMDLARKEWQRQLLELEGQVRDLKNEVDELRANEAAQEYCSACGRGGSVTTMRMEELRNAGVKVGGGIVNRPRARTGVGSRFASGT